MCLLLHTISRRPLYVHCNAVPVQPSLSSAASTLCQIDFHASGCLVKDHVCASDTRAARTTLAIMMCSELPEGCLMSSAVQMDNGLDTYQSDGEPEQAAERGGPEDEVKPNVPAKSLAPSVDASDLASSAKPLAHAPSSAGVCMQMF